MARHISLLLLRIDSSNDKVLTTTWKSLGCWYTSFGLLRSLVDMCMRDVGVSRLRGLVLSNQTTMKHWVLNAGKSEIQL